MTDRKPQGMSWESWVDRQVREAEERGEFDNLPRGPIRSLGEPYREDWWLRELIAREGVDHTHPILVLRSRIERELQAVLRLAGESAVRRRVAALNDEIRAANRGDLGPLPPIRVVDEEAVVAGWRKARAGDHPTAGTTAD